MEPSEEILAFMRRHKAVAVVGHEEPDGDCVGSQLALVAALNRHGWNATPINVGPFRRPEIRPYEQEFVSSLSDAAEILDAVVVVDCSSEDRVGSVAKEFGDLPVAVIDHHATGSAFGSVRYVDPSTPATTMLIFRLLKRLSIRPSEQEANLLFFGLVTDTGFFRFLDSGQADALAIGAELVGLGASPRTVQRWIESKRSYASRLLLGRLLNRSEQIADGKVILTYQTTADIHEFGPDARDSDALYRLLLSVVDTEVMAVVKEDPDQGGCTVSLRSNSYQDVAGIAAEFGGGGHKNASGFFSALPAIELLPVLRNRLLQLFQE